MKTTRIPHAPGTPLPELAELVAVERDHAILHHELLHPGRLHRILIRIRAPQAPGRAEGAASEPEVGGCGSARESFAKSRL